MGLLIFNSMINKIKALAKKDHSIFLLSNIIFSGSTYLVMLFVPYMLNLEKMAEFSLVYNALIMMLFIFEFGISTTFLRFYQIKKSTYLINSIVQLIILMLLLLIMNMAIGDDLFEIFNLSEFDFSKNLFLIALVLQLSWIFTKNIFLSYKRYSYILIASLLILIFRISGFYFLDQNITVDNIIIYMFIVPFILIGIFIILDSFKTLLSIKLYYISFRILKLFLHQLKQFLRFSFLTYIIGFLYILTGRYLMIFLSDTGKTSIIADLGYAMTFLGVVTIFSTSFRTFFISKFKSNDKDSIHLYLDRYLKKIKWFSLYGIASVLIISIIVHFIKPDYLSINTSIYLFISLSSYTLILLLSLITFFSKTMNYNNLELNINIIRFILVYVTCQFVVLEYPILGFIIINFIILFSEIYFAKKVLKRLKYVS